MYRGHRAGLGRWGYEAKKALAEAIQARAIEIGTHAPLGEVVDRLAARDNVTGWVIGPGDVYWNVRKD